MLSHENDRARFPATSVFPYLLGGVLKVFDIYSQLAAFVLLTLNIHRRRYS